MKKSRIGIDGFNIAKPEGSGAGAYSINLNVSLRQLGFETALLYGPARGAGRDALLNEVTLFDAPPAPSALRNSFAVLKQISSLSAPLGRKAYKVGASGAVITRHIARNAPACDQIWSSRDVFHGANRAYRALGRFTPLTFADDGAPDVMHWTCPLPLRARGRPNLYTIRDLAPLRLPFATAGGKRRYLNLCREICATAEKIVTVSEHSAQDMVRSLGVGRDRIAVTYQSIDLPDALMARADEDIARDIAGVFELDWRGYFILFAGVAPKADIDRAIEAYLASGVKAPLVIVGRQARRDGAVRRSDPVRLYDRMPFDLLVGLIRGAKATLLPLPHGGSFPPVLESMQLGTPILTSTEGAVPEIAGDAALLVAAGDTQALAKAIVALDADADLRDDLRARGVARAEKFSPEAYRQRLATLYQPYL